MRVSAAGCELSLRVPSCPRQTLVAAGCHDHTPWAAAVVERLPCCEGNSVLEDGACLGAVIRAGNDWQGAAVHPMTGPCRPSVASQVAWPASRPGAGRNDRVGCLAEQAKACHKTAGEWADDGERRSQRWALLQTSSFAVQLCEPATVLRQVREQGI
jgi:hypothetical protein